MVGAALKVGADAVGQRGGFADIEQLTGRVPKEIHAGMVGQVVELGLKSVGRHTSSVNRKNSRNHCALSCRLTNGA